MKRVLIFEANSQQALAISKFVHRYSNYYIVGAVEKSIEFNTNNYHKIVIGNFEDLDLNHYDYILPMGAKSSYEIVEKYGCFIYENGICFKRKNLIVFDKQKMLEIATTANVRVPKTWYSKDTIETFPLFYKEKFEAGGGTRGIALDLKDIPNNDSLLYQEYIATEATYGVAFLAKNGNIVTFTIHKETISLPPSGGSAVVIESFYDEKLLKYTKSLLKQLNYCGWGLAEYKYCSKGKDFVFMEINGKFWASVEFTLQNNPKFLHNLLGIKYDIKKVDKMLFINRFLRYSFVDIVKNMKFLFNTVWVKESSVIYQLVRSLIPQRVITLIKWIKS